MMDGDKRLQILGYMNDHMPKTLTWYKIKDAVANADSYLDLPEIMVVLLCQLVETNEDIRTTASELIKNSYKKTYVHAMPCNTEYGKL